MVTTEAMKIFPKSMANSVIPERIPNLRMLDVMTLKAFMAPGQNPTDLKIVSM
jgi:hypothetical protein